MYTKLCNSLLFLLFAVPLKCNFTHACVLVCLHMCVNMLPIMYDGVLASLTYCTHMLHEGTGGGSY